jgi:hypothetical protein
MDGIHAEEGEEEIRFDPFHACAVRHDQRGIDPLERALGNEIDTFVMGCGAVSVPGAPAAFVNSSVMWNSSRVDA